MQITSLLNQSAITAVGSYAGINSTSDSAETGAQDSSLGLDKVTLFSEGLKQSKANGESIGIFL